MKGLAWANDSTHFEVARALVKSVQFIAIREEIRVDLAEQAVRLGELKASGELVVTTSGGSKAR